MFDPPGGEGGDHPRDNKNNNNNNDGTDSLAVDAPQAYGLTLPFPSTPLHQPAGHLPDGVTSQLLSSASGTWEAWGMRMAGRGSPFAPHTYIAEMRDKL